jgi:hypothetical protein
MTVVALAAIHVRTRGPRMHGSPARPDPGQGACRWGGAVSDAAPFRRGEAGFGRKQPAIRVADGEPGQEVQAISGGRAGPGPGHRRFSPSRAEHPAASRLPGDTAHRRGAPPRPPVSPDPRQNRAPGARDAAGRLGRVDQGHLRPDALRRTDLAAVPRRLLQRPPHGTGRGRENVPGQRVGPRRGPPPLHRPHRTRRTTQPVRGLPRVVRKPRSGRQARRWFATAAPRLWCHSCARWNAEPCNGRSGR